MQHELGIAAKQTRGVDAQGKIAADALAGIAIDRRLRFAVDPAAFHRRVPVRRSQGIGVRPRAPQTGGPESIQACAQLLPSTRLLHQPERRGRSLFSLSAELVTTGSIGGMGVAKAGGAELHRRATPGVRARARSSAGAAARTPPKRRAPWSAPIEPRAARAGASARPRAAARRRCAARPSARRALRARFPLPPPIRARFLLPPT